jgi:hypothetical protein
MMYEGNTMADKADQDKKPHQDTVIRKSPNTYGGKLIESKPKQK